MRRNGLDRRSLLLFVGLAVFAGCGGREELTIYLDADLDTVQVDNTRLVIGRNGDERYRREIEPLDLGGGAALLLRLENDEGAGSEIDIVFQGLKEEVVVVERRVEVAFGDGHRVVPVHLCQACLGKLDCATGETCLNGSCVDANVDRDDLKGVGDDSAYALSCGGGGGGGGGGGPGFCDSRCETEGCGECPFQAITGSLSLNFSIDRYEVTRAEYQAFLEVNPVPHDGLPEVCRSNVDFSPDPGALAQACSGNCDDHPVVGITGCDAAAYCHWATGFLCFDTSWQAACEGPTTGVQTLYPYGDAYEAGRCNDGGQNAGTVAANAIAPTCEGSLDTLYNMSGNAAELVRIAPDGDFQVRGGHYESTAADLSCLATTTAPPAGSAQVGFRCCY